MNEHVGLSFGHGADTWEKGGGKGVRKNGIVYEEHTFNADVGMRVKKILEDHGLKVWLPQQPMAKDRSLKSRTDEANRRGVKLYWDIHADAGVSSAEGVCAYYWHTNSKAKKLAEEYAKNAREAGLKTHGSGTRASRIGDWTNFHTLRETRMTAILTENGFMTNSNDFEGIFGRNKGAYRQKVAEVNAKTILSYFGIKYDSGKSEVVAPSPNPNYTTDPTERLGEVVLKMEMNYRKEPSLNAPILRKLPEGHGSNKPVHFYEVKGDWLRLGSGWVSNKGGKYVDIVKVYDKTPQPAEPKKPVYRVIVDGKQEGAYSEDSNVLKQIKEAMGHLSEDIKIEKV